MNDLNDKELIEKLSMALLGLGVMLVIGTVAMAIFMDYLLHCINRFYNIVWALCWPVRLPFLVISWIWNGITKKKMEDMDAEEQMHPEQLSEPWTMFLRGSRITTLEKIYKFYWSNMRKDTGHILVAGVPFPVEVILNKLTFIGGISGSGKSTIQDLSIIDLARLANERQLESFTNRKGETEQKGTKLVVIDPDDTKLGLIYSCMSSDVEFFLFSPHHANGIGWDIKTDIGDSWEMFTIFLETLFPPSMRARANDQFWIDNAISLMTAIYMVFRELGSDYRIEDFFIPLAFPQFLEALLDQTPRTKAIGEDILKGRSGKDVAKTLKGRVTHLLLAAGYMQKAKTRVPLKRFINSKKAVLHLGYSSNQKSAFGQMYNMMLSMLVALTIEQKEEGFNDCCYFMVDELPDLSDLAALDKVAKVGRKHGMGAMVGALSVEALNSAWTESRTQELLSLVDTWLMLRSSLQTSEYFSRLLGYFEGFIESYGKSTAKNSGESESWGSSGNQGTYSYQVSTSYNWANTTNLSLTQRLALLVSQLTGLPMPDVNGGRDNLVGYGWNGTTGLWKFIIQGGVSTINFMQRRLTGKYMKPAIRPKTHAELNPWTIEDLKRLNIKRTQAMMKAMSKV